MKKLIWIIIILAVIAGIWHVSSQESAGPVSGETIKIGAVLPMTGAGASYGEDQKRAIALAVEEINAEGGVRGIPLEVIYEDDQTDPKVTVSAAQKLINVDGVKVIIGGVWDHLANAIAPVIDQEKIVLISPSVNADTVGVSSPYFFMTYPPVASMGPAFEEFLTKFENPKVVTMTWNNNWGLGHAEVFKEAVAKTGGQVVKEIVLTKPDGNDIQRELTLLVPLNPDIIFTVMNFSDTAVFARKKSELGIKATTLNHYNLATTYLNGQIPNEFMEGLYVFKNSPSNTEFVEKYKNRYQMELQIPDADSAYDAVHVIRLALENNGGDTSADALVSGIHAIKNYQGASGLIDFSQTNYTENKKPVLEVFQGGKFVEVK